MIRLKKGRVCGIIGVLKLIWGDYNEKDAVKKKNDPLLSFRYREGPIQRYDW